MSKSLTGRQRFRIEGSLVVLEVEEVDRSDGLYSNSFSTNRWRDATIGDVTEHETPKLAVERPEQDCQRQMPPLSWQHDGP